MSYNESVSCQTNHNTWIFLSYLNFQKREPFLSEPLDFFHYVPFDSLTHLCIYFHLQIPTQPIRSVDASYMGGPVTRTRGHSDRSGPLLPEDTIKTELASNPFCETINFDQTKTARTSK